MTKDIHIGIPCVAMEMFSFRIADECTIYGHDFNIMIIRERTPAEILEAIVSVFKEWSQDD